MDQEKFARRICEELGEGINPLYVEGILKENVPDFLRWLQSMLQSMAPTMQEALYYSVIYQEQANEEMRDLLLLCMGIIGGQFKLISFLMKEMRARIEAIDASVQLTRELPAIQDGLKENK
mgnify:CR=1 FL=1